jgi:hypothetical protein
MEKACSNFKLLIEIIVLFVSSIKLNAYGEDNSGKMSDITDNYGSDTFAILFIIVMLVLARIGGLRDRLKKK